MLLAHQPKQIVEAAALGVGLQLSGHTHGGPIYPWHLFVKLDQPYLAGLALHGETQIYVSRGAAERRWLSQPGVAGTIGVSPQVPEGGGHES